MLVYLDQGSPDTWKTIFQLFKNNFDASVNKYTTYCQKEYEISQVELKETLKTYKTLLWI